VNTEATPADAPPSGSQSLITPPGPDLVQTLMAFQRTMPSWKAWQRETMSWEGTADENIERYVENVGLEDDDGVDPTP